MERRPVSLLKCLHQRQLGQVDLCGVERIVSLLTTRRVPLTSVLDCDRLILDGHVVLGFSRCGRLLLSYSCELDVTATLATYTLHWWLFLSSSLRHVFSEALFRGESVPTDLHLQVCQTASPVHTIVMGCKRTSPEDYHRPCYVTIILSSLPSSNCFVSSQCTSLHFKFDLVPPFPSFIPSLSLKLPGWVILNTGDSLVALCYSSPPCLPSLSSPPTSFYSSHLKQVFGLSAARHTTSPIVIGSPAHLLAVDVYCNEQMLMDRALSNEENGGIVAVQQTNLDVEVWVNASLHAELAAGGKVYHSLVDYDLRLAGVCASSGNVLLMMSILLEASESHANTSLSCYSVEITASWNIYSGIAHSLYISDLQPAQPSCLGGHREWSSAAAMAIAFRQHSQLPLTRHSMVRAFSNHTVFSGKSLRCLLHPYLPLALTLTPHTSFELTLEQE